MMGVFPFTKEYCMKHAVEPVHILRLLFECHYVPDLPYRIACSRCNVVRSVLLLEIDIIGKESISTGVVRGVENYLSST
jgi:hypothetical protein